MKTFVNTFGLSVVVSLAALVVAFLYGGITALTLALLLGIMEVSLSFDNAIVNARVLERMSAYWQKIFLTIGVIIAVFGMRLVMPLALVSATTGLSFTNVIALALEKGDPHKVGTYGYYLQSAHPQIAAFGGIFLLMLFLDFILEDRDIRWLSFIEKPLAKVGALNGASYFISIVALGAASFLAEDQAKVLIAGLAGLGVYILVNGLGQLFEGDGEDDDEVPGIHGSSEDIGAAFEATARKHGQSNTVKVVGKAAFFLFLYIEVLDASFSFDGVVSAFAITADPIIIALGLGFIGAIFVRSITIFLVKQGTLNDYRYLDHGAHWAIGALAAILLISIGHEIPEVVTGLIGVFLIGAAFISSIVKNRKEAKEELAAGSTLPVNSDATL
jgi:hypothetical protein